LQQETIVVVIRNYTKIATHKISEYTDPNCFTWRNTKHQV